MRLRNKKCSHEILVFLGTQTCLLTWAADAHLHWYLCKHTKPGCNQTRLPTYVSSIALCILALQTCSFSAFIDKLAFSLNFRFILLSSSEAKRYGVWVFFQPLEHPVMCPESITWVFFLLSAAPVWLVAIAALLCSSLPTTRKAVLQTWQLKLTTHLRKHASVVKHGAWHDII